MHHFVSRIKREAAARDEFNSGQKMKMMHRPSEYVIPPKIECHLRSGNVNTTLIGP
jgi:hypothetical protein